MAHVVRSGGVAGGDVLVMVQLAVNRVCPPWVQPRICYQWSCFLKGTWRDMFAAPGYQVLSSQLPVLAFHQFLLPEMFKIRRNGSWSLPRGTPDGKICFFMLSFGSLSFFSRNLLIDASGSSSCCSGILENTSFPLIRHVWRSIIDGDLRQYIG